MLQYVLGVLAVSGAVGSNTPTLPNCPHLSHDEALMNLCLGSDIAFVGTMSQEETATPIPGGTLVKSVVKATHNVKNAVVGTEYTIHEELFDDEPCPTPSGLPERPHNGAEYLIHAFNIEGRITMIPCEQWDCMESTLFNELFAQGKTLDDLCPPEMEYPMKK